MSGISMSFSPYTLELRHQFTVASFSRATTPIILVELKLDNYIGYGEASMPPYLGESQESVIRFLSKVNLSQFNDPLQLDTILDYIDNLEPENTAAKASLDIALHDLMGKIFNKPLYEMFELNSVDCPQTCITIGIDTPEIMASKMQEAEGFSRIKIKLGTDQDKDIIRSIRQTTSLPLMVDVNQGWISREHALEMAFWLKEQGVLMLEQPLPKEKKDDIAWLSERSPIPVFADEGIKRMEDLRSCLGIYNGVNVKLMKSTGLREAKAMLEFARKSGMLIMIGCMTETSCAVLAAAHLSPLCEYADLDGTFLITNNPFLPLKLEQGKIVLSQQPGIGVEKGN
jgi:L-Ala-D/L-Glu epimerase